jgi:hypothetical protein
MPVRGKMVFEPGDSNPPIVPKGADAESNSLPPKYAMN